MVLTINHLLISDSVVYIHLKCPYLWDMCTEIFSLFWACN